MKISWNQKTTNYGLTFADLELNETFQIDSNHSKGAIYAKVKNNRNLQEYMYEIATGKLFEPTLSPVKRVLVDVNIKAEKPTIY